MRQVVVRLSPTVAASEVAEPPAPVAAATARSSAAARSTDWTRVAPDRFDEGDSRVTVSPDSLTGTTHHLYVA
jgi:hypothetical protein